jgi:hypothetical protein
MSDREGVGLDDDASFRALARAILEPAGFEVIESEDFRIA